MSNAITLYSTSQVDKKIEVFFQDENFWLTQKRMAELFGVEVNTVNYHLKEIFKTRELTEDSVIRKIRTTADDGKGVMGGNTADYRQSKKSHNRWDKLKRLKKTNKLLSEQENGRFP